MTSRPVAVNAMTTPLITVTPKSTALNSADLTPAAAWSRRVRRVGGFIQAAFHDLADLRPARPPGRARLSTKAG